MTLFEEKLDAHNTAGHIIFWANFIFKFVAFIALLKFIFCGVH